MFLTLFLRNNIHISFVTEESFTVFVNHYFDSISMYRVIIVIYRVIICSTATWHHFTVSASHRLQVFMPGTMLTDSTWHYLAYNVHKSWICFIMQYCSSRRFDGELITPDTFNLNSALITLLRMSTWIFNLSTSSGAIIDY